MKCLNTPLLVTDEQSKTKYSVTSNGQNAIGDKMKMQILSERFLSFYEFEAQPGWAKHTRKQALTTPRPKGVRIKLTPTIIYVTSNGEIRI